MSWPERLTIRVTTTSDAVPLPRLIVDVVVVAEGKNPYPLGFFQTDDQGTITMTLDDVGDALKRIQDQSLMDYSSLNLETQTEFEVQITADPLRSLRGRLGSLRTFYPDVALRLERMLRDASNPDDWGHLWAARIDKTTARLILDFPSPVRKVQSDVVRV